MWKKTLFASALALALFTGCTYTGTLVSKYTYKTTMPTYTIIDGTMLPTGQEEEIINYILVVELPDGTQIERHCWQSQYEKFQIGYQTTVPAIQ